MAGKIGNGVVGVCAVCKPLAEGKSISEVVASLFNQGATLNHARKLLAGASFLTKVDHKKKVLVVTDRDKGGQKTQVDISGLWLAKNHCAGKGPMACWQGDCPIGAGC
ncbi:hypothetical protein COV49_00420 [Candidatus Falkowbacteria bacterium CG11_big_fil_rev_8_21_14_0_20_39_10]|uniref:Uncharacterized protein n=1 Tax=Candidatus Falkowbacteria bacterium CG11_big_fil_rev_8_21_14_0_20_39_10 TaxID=1974570 RepID=A0A2M6KAD7_9BACT|nr:MAG: hypothetical protein COV49_00420 [Candidatus Falkowbacteria bacterium CG11_big_fil_rev_8_21_14_0_20_39_10]